MLPLNGVRILIVEDNENDYELIIRALRSNGFAVGTTARAWDEPSFVREVCEKPLDIIICDYHLIGIDATKIVEILNEHNSDIPMIILSGSMTNEQERKTSQPYLTKDRLTRIIPVVERELHQTKNYEEVLMSWGKAVEIKDHHTGGHSKRVAELTVALARAMHLCELDIINMRRGAYLHDIGKVMVEDSILLKAGPLTDEEWEQMKQHPAIARDLLAPMKFMAKAIEIPYSHHERWDGKGYPQGLKGEEIPIAARIFAVVDNYDALTSRRPYREPMSAEYALKYIQGELGTLFDPWIAMLFVDMMTTAAAPSAGEARV